jgi:polar amino acid transport system substrate-binding protein
LKHTLFTLGLFCLSFFLSSQSFASEKITVRSDFWCPYNCKPGSEDPGYMIEILEKTFGKENIQYEELNWARSIKETRDGKWDLIVGASTGDAPDFVYPKSSLGNSTNCFYVRKDNPWVYKDISSLKGQTLGVIQNYAYFDALNQYIASNEKVQRNVQVHSGTDALIRMLQKLSINRITAVVEDGNVMSYALRSYPKFTDMRMAGCVVLDSLYIAFAPNNPKSKERAAKLDTEINQMEKSGELTTLLKKYRVQPWYK